MRLRHTDQPTAPPAAGRGDDQLTLADAARYMAVTRPTAERWALLGRFPTRLVAGRTIAVRSDLDAFMRSELFRRGCLRRAAALAADAKSERNALEQVQDATRARLAGGAQGELERAVADQNRAE